MSSPKERSEARKKALLSRGGDRLKKLTNSARGEDAPQFLHDDPPLVAPLKSFIGESTPDPHPSTIHTPTPAPAPASGPTAAQYPDWSPEELHRAMESFGAPGPTVPPFLQDSMPAQPAAGGKASAQRIPAFLTLRQRLSPLFRLLAPLCILFYFVLFHEPGLYNSSTRVEEPHWSVRWSNLSDLGGLQRSRRSEAVHSAPFFNTFISIQLVQQLVETLFLSAPSGLPYFFTLISPHLPLTFNHWLTRIVFCMRIFKSLLDYTAVSVFGLGAVIWLSRRLSKL